MTLRGGCCGVPSTSPRASDPVGALQDDARGGTIAPQVLGSSVQGGGREVGSSGVSAVPVRQDLAGIVE